MIKLYTFIFIIIFNISLFSNSIASIPFRGETLNKDSAEMIASIFVSEFIPLGYKLVTRTSAQQAINAELSYQRSGATRDAINFGKQLKANFVLVGAVAKFDYRYSVYIQLINVSTGSIEGSSSYYVNTLSDINRNVAQIMANEIDKSMKQNKSDYSASFYDAVKINDYETAKDYLERGADPNYKPYNSSSPILIAVLNNNTAMVKLILESGGRPKEELSYARNIEIAKLLSDYNSSYNTYTLVRNSTIEVMKFLVSIGSDSAYYILDNLVDLGDYNMVYQFIESGKVPYEENRYGNCLIKACRNSNRDIVHLLLQYGANPNYKNSSGDTPFKVTKNSAITALLLQYSNRR